MADQDRSYPFKPGDRCNIEQYWRLKRCSDRKDIGEWNAWRDDNRSEEIRLSGANLRGAYLEGADLKNAHLERTVLYSAHLKGADLRGAHLEKAALSSACLSHAAVMAACLDDAELYEASLTGADLTDASLRHADLMRSHLEGTRFYDTNLRDASFEMAKVDGTTEFLCCHIDHYTIFNGVALGNTCIDAGLKQLLDYNIRRYRWHEWYYQHRRLGWLVAFFWELSDYGKSTYRILQSLWCCAFFFAGLYLFVALGCCLLAAR